MLETSYLATATTLIIHAPDKQICQQYKGKFNEEKRHLARPMWHRQSTFKTFRKHHINKKTKD